MDGKALLRSTREELLESGDSGFMDDRTTFNYLWEAATEFVNRTHSMQTTSELTTVADQATYTLNYDFLKLYLRTEHKRFYVVLNDGNSNHFILWRDYERIVSADQGSTNALIPDFFTILADPTIPDVVTGTATSTASATGGASTLTDTAADFSDVNPGDTVHNTTDESDGVVTGKTSSTVLTTALFDGTANDWTTLDAYVIQPQTTFDLIFDPPPSTAGLTVTVYQIKRPDPVYTDFGIYPVPVQYHPAFASYAAWRYKYRDIQPNMGDRLFLAWDRAVKQAADQLNLGLNRGSRVTVNLKNRRR